MLRQLAASTRLVKRFRLHAKGGLIRSIEAASTRLVKRSTDLM